MPVGIFTRILFTGIRAYILKRATVLILRLHRYPTTSFTGWQSVVRVFVCT